MLAKAALVKRFARSRWEWKFTRRDNPGVPAVPAKARNAVRIANQPTSIGFELVHALVVP